MITDKHFTDWESHVFGFGYGSGEEHVIGTLNLFFDLCKDKESANPMYDYRELERVMGPTTTWFVINALCHADIIEYGCSPRFAWLTQAGVDLREYMSNRTTEELCNVIENADEVRCFPDLCQCENPCNNPLWRKRR